MLCVRGKSLPGYIDTANSICYVPNTIDNKLTFH